MEFFREKGDRFMAESISGNPGARSGLRLLMLLLSVGVVAYILFFTPAGENPDNRIPLIIGMAVLLFSSGMSMVLRKAGLGSGLVVDLSRGTLSYRKPGSNRYRVHIASLKRIIITTIPTKASILTIEKRDGGRHILMYSTDTMKMRMFAEELASLTSLTLDEEVDDRYTSHG